MTAFQSYSHQGLNGPTLVDLRNPVAPEPATIRERVYAASLNFHDPGVVTGRLPCANGRIPWRITPGWWWRLAPRSRSSGPAAMSYTPSFRPGWTARLPPLSKKTETMR